MDVEIFEIAVFARIAKLLADPRLTSAGGVVIIPLTVAVVDPVFPATSTKSKVNDPFAAKVFVRAPLLFVTVMDSFAPVRVAMTGGAVVPEYTIVAVGAIKSPVPVPIIPVAYGVAEPEA